MTGVLGMSSMEKIQGLPKVSVIMNCLNCSRYLKEAIDSVYAQTYKDWEIIFWDNASIDRSAEIAKGYDSKLKYYRGDETVPLSVARNFALEKARGEFIAFLDCDDEWLPQKLQEQVRILENDVDVDFIYSNFLMFDMEYNRRNMAFKKKQPEGYVFEQFLYNYPVGLLTAMIRRKALGVKDELFDINLKFSSDYDLFMRLLYKFKAAYIDKPTAIYRIHSDMSSIKNMKYFADENTYIINKLKKLDENVAERYSKAFRYCEIQVEYLRGKARMANGELREARKHFAPYKIVNFRFFIFYISSYIPTRLWFLLRPIWANGAFR